jgi:hypothetical protein
MLMFVGAGWVDVASAFALCVVGADWFADCACPPCASFGAGDSLGCCRWELSWWVSLEFPLVAVLEELSCCVLFPPPATFVDRWLEVAEACAVCVVGAL